MKIVKIPGLNLVALLALVTFFLAGCGAVVDMAEDNEWRWGYFGKLSFVSPAKLRIGVAPFSDEVGLGAVGTGYNLANLMTEEFNRDSRLVVVPVEQVQQAITARGYSTILTPQQAAEIAADLKLNAIVLGSLSEVKQYNVRKGWRRLARIVTDQRQYVDAVLAVSAVDAQTGIVLVSRANQGEYDGGSGNKDLFEAGDRSSQGPEQEALEASLDNALKESYHRTIKGLADLPFKARVISSSGGEATIAFGQDVGLRKGENFAKLEIERTITNTIGEMYQIMGAPVAKLKVSSVGEATAILTVEEGQVAVGDTIQALN